MKILFVFNHPAPYKVRLFNELVKDKDIELDVIFERKSASDRPKDFYNCDKYDFNAMFLKHGAFSREQSNTGELVKYIKENYKKYNLIVMNGYSTITEIRAIRYMKKKHIPFALYVNGGVVREKENALKRKFKTSLIKSAFHYYSPCKEASDFLKFYGAQNSQISEYIYSTLYEKDVLEKPLSEKEKLFYRTRFGLPEEGKIFVTFGQFIPRKNNIQLLTQFIGRKDNLVMIGEGPEKQEYLRIINENHMQNVKIFDFVKKDVLFDMIKGCDCFITLSKEDIYGHTTNEAMANGLPVISSDCVVSSKHLIKDGYNGFLIPLDDNAKIQEALNNINSEMIDNAIKTARENTIEKSAMVHAKLFKEIVEWKSFIWLHH